MDGMEDVSSPTNPAFITRGPTDHQIQLNPRFRWVWWDHWAVPSLKPKKNWKSSGKGKTPPLLREISYLSIFSDVNLSVSGKVDAHVSTMISSCLAPRFGLFYLGGGIEGLQNNLITEGLQIYMYIMSRQCLFVSFLKVTKIPIAGN